MVIFTSYYISCYRDIQPDNDASSHSHWNGRNAPSFALSKLQTNVIILYLIFWIIPFYYIDYNFSVVLYSVPRSKEWLFISCMELHDEHIEEFFRSLSNSRRMEILSDPAPYKAINDLNTPHILWYNYYWMCNHAPTTVDNVDVSTSTLLTTRRQSTPAAFLSATREFLFRDLGREPCGTDIDCLHIPYSMLIC